MPKSSQTSPSVDALAGPNICTSLDAGFTDFLRGLKAYFDAHKLILKTIVADTRRQKRRRRHLFIGRCDAMSADASELAEALIVKAPHPEDFVILPQQITKEPLAPLLRKGDEQFFDAVRWAIIALDRRRGAGRHGGQSRALARKLRSRP